MRTLSRIGLMLSTTATLAALAALTACGGGGSGSSSPAPTGNPPDPQPSTQFVALGTSANTVSLAWKAPAPAATYTVERKSAGGDYLPIATLSAGTTSYLDEGLAKRTAYSYRLVSTAANHPTLGEGTATTSSEDAVVTVPGTAIGQPSTQTLGAAGGQVTSPDGLITLAAPAGSLAGDTDVVMQPTTNTAPDGRDNAVKIRLSAAPSQALALRVKYGNELDNQADGLRIAVQRGDGSWLSLPPAQIDKATHTLSAVLPAELLAAPHAKQASALARARTSSSSANVSIEFTVVKYLALYLAPKEARVAVKSSLGLVPYARVRGYETEIGTCVTLDEGIEACVMQPVMETRQIPFLNTKAGFKRGWYVFLDEGGNATDGTIAPNGTVGATYTAPHKVPDPSTVVASFQSTNLKTGQTVVLAAPITILDDQWVGTMSSSDGPSLAGTTILTNANVTWRLDDTASTEGKRVYRPEGTLGVVITDNDCVAIVSPSVQPISTNPQLVSLEIDDSVSPARYKARLITFWNATATGTCPKASATRNILAGWGWDVQGTVSGDGSTITGSAMQDTATIEWSFHR